MFNNAFLKPLCWSAYATCASRAEEMACWPELELEWNRISINISTDINVTFLLIWNRNHFVTRLHFFFFFFKWGEEKSVMLKQNSKTLANFQTLQLRNILQHLWPAAQGLFMHYSMSILSTCTWTLCTRRGKQTRTVSEFRLHAR